MPVVMISGHGTIETAVAAIQHGAYDFIEKPFQSDRLLLVVRRALEAAAAGARERRAAAARRAGDRPDRRQPGHRRAARRRCERVAPTGSRVLITGPPGRARRSWRA